MRLVDAELKAINSATRRLLHRWVEFPLLKLIGLRGEGLNVLEVGCGSGYGAKLLFTLPLLINGATDMAPLRAKGVQAYGLGAVETAEDTERVHGNDERVSIEGLGKLAELTYRAVTGVAAER